MSNIKTLSSTVQAAVRGIGKGIDAVREMVGTPEGCAELCKIAERYADLAKSPSCDDVKRLRSLIRKAGTFKAGGKPDQYLPDADGHALTVKFREGVASVQFASKSSRTGADPVAKALAAYIKACRASEDGIDLARAVAMLEAEWQDDETVEASDEE